MLDHDYQQRVNKNFSVLMAESKTRPILSIIFTFFSPSLTLFIRKRSKLVRIGHHFSVRSINVIVSLVRPQQQV